MRGAVCTICTEFLDGSRDVSVLRCGHLFHGDCLSPWLSKSLTCPQCRQNVTRANVIHKLFFSWPDVEDSSATATQELARVTSRLEDAQNRLSIRDQELAKLSAEKSAIADQASELTESYRLPVLLYFSVQ